jgi:hypothetical protein
MRRLQLLLSVALLLVIIQSLVAQIPRNISYQGILTDSLGNPKPDGKYKFTFRLYTSQVAEMQYGLKQKAFKLNKVFSLQFLEM